MPGKWEGNRPTRELLRDILEEHRKWFKSEGREGKRADLSWAYVREADLREAYLREADLSGAKLIGADLTGADLTGADLSRANLTEADLSGANLSRANLTRANLTRANLIRTDLIEANLTGAYLTRANLTGANLTGAGLKYAILNGTILWGARLDGADFTQTTRRKTRVRSSIDLLVVKGLDDLEGFFFDEDPNSQEARQEREQESARVFGADLSTVTVGFPESYSPADLGRVLIYLTMMYEGLRLIMTKPIEDLEDLLNQVIRPELFGPIKDEYALTFESIQSGSIIAKVKGLKGVWKTIKGMGKVVNLDITRKSMKQDVIIKGMDSVVSLFDNEKIPQEIKTEATKVLKTQVRALGGIADQVVRPEERIEPAIQVYSYTANKILQLILRQDEDLEITDEDKKPLIEFPKDGKADDYEETEKESRHPDDSDKPEEE